MTAPNIIGGSIPFGPGGNPLQGLASGGLQGLANQYETGYNSALAQNQAMYNNIMGGYQQTMAHQTSASDAIAGGYNNLYNNVLGSIQGIDASQRQALADMYAQQSGGMAQSLINRGLGNTTVADTMQRGLLLDNAKANIALTNQTQQLNAGYMSQLGLAGLDYANQANMQGTGLASRQLDFMNSVTAKYPNQGDYYNLFDASGRFKQMNADRAAMMAAQRMQMQGGGMASGGGGVVHRAPDVAPFGSNPLSQGLGYSTPFGGYGYSQGTGYGMMNYGTGASAYDYTGGQPQLYDMALNQTEEPGLADTTPDPETGLLTDYGSDLGTTNDSTGENDYYNNSFYADASDLGYGDEGY